MKTKKMKIKKVRISKSFILNLLAAGAYMFILPDYLINGNYWYSVLALFFVLVCSINVAMMNNNDEIFKEYYKTIDVVK